MMSRANGLYSTEAICAGISRWIIFDLLSWWLNIAAAPVPMSLCYARSTPSDGRFIATRPGLEQNEIQR